MTRALLRPLTATLALATGIGLLGVAITLRASPTAGVGATATAEATAEASPVLDALPAAGLLAAGVPMDLPDGPAFVRVWRLVLAPDATLPPFASAAPTTLVVAAGTVGITFRVKHWVLTGSDHPNVQVGSDETEVGVVLDRGEHLSLRPGSTRTVRTIGPAPATILIVVIEPQQLSHG
jgi:hypothetical protein